MNRIELAYNKARSENRCCFIPFFEVGYPTMDDFSKVMNLLVRYGDIVELGVPFSDPIADGPIIQHASNIAIKNGITLDRAFEWVANFRRKDKEIPLVFMLYYNLIHHKGAREFFKEAKEVDIDGVIIPDLPLEELDNIYPYKDSISIILLASSTTNERRLKLIAEKSEGFIYCVSVKGVTGPRDNISNEGLELVKKVKRFSGVPVALGFGIKDPEQVKKVSSIVDGIIIGSEIIRIVEDSSIEHLEDYLEKIIQSTNSK
ncbi:MAG: tryptophan synthase subunit alpha [bacterium]